MVSSAMANCARRLGAVSILPILRLPSSLSPLTLHGQDHLFCLLTFILKTFYDRKVEEAYDEHAFL